MATQPEERIITFIRIGTCDRVPDLRIPSGPPAAVREKIRGFVGDRLNTGFSIRLWPDHGYIEVDHHSAGVFTIRPVTGDTRGLQEI